VRERAARVVGQRTVVLLVTQMADFLTVPMDFESAQGFAVPLPAPHSALAAAFGPENC